ncbi:site-specific integrase [Candidatus Woesearchaeota archaeon]|nr:site-specific integrase [Candidatus Woesearchaeota archaeon]
MLEITDCKSLISRFQAAKLSTRSILIYGFLRFCGLRISELAKIKLSQINHEKLILTDKKHITVPPILLSVIPKTNHEFIIESNSKPLSIRRIQQILKETCKIAKIAENNARELRAHYLKEQTAKNPLRPALKSIRKKKESTDQEILTFGRSITNKRDRLIFLILKETGCTPKELTLLTRKNLIGSKIFFPKTTKLNERYVAISESLYQLLKSYSTQKKSDNSLISSRETPMSTRRISQLFSFYSKRSGISISPRLLRNHVIRKTIEEGRPLDCLGIRHITIYSHGALACKRS